MASASWLLLGLMAAVALLAILAWTRHFRFRGGYWVRLRPRHRWSIGPRRYRLAQSLGYRYSTRHDALVPGIRGGHFGPVFKLRSAEAAHRSGGAPGERPARTRCTLDMAVMPLPHAPRNADLWQMTAVDLHTRYAWADLVRRSRGPTAKQLASFVKRIAGELEESGRDLGTLIVREPPAGLFEHGLLPAGVRLLAPERSAARPEAAAAVHEQIAEEDTAPLPAGESLAHLRGRLRHRIAAYNAEQHAPRLAQRSHY